MERSRFERVHTSSSSGIKCIFLVSFVVRSLEAVAGPQCSLLGIGLLSGVAGHKFGDRLQVVHHGHNARELAHIHLKALGVVHLRRQEHVRERQDISKAVLAFRQLELGFEGRQALSNGPVSPGLFLLWTGAEPTAQLSQHAQVLHRLSARVDHLAKATHLEPLQRVLRQQLPLARISFFEVLADGHGLREREGFLGEVLVLDNECGHELNTDTSTVKLEYLVRARSI